MDAVEILSKIGKQGQELDRTIITEKPGYYLPFTVTGPQPFSADADVFMAPVPRARVMFRRLVVAVFVATTNTGAHYWTINLETDVLGVIGSVNTSAIAPDTWEILEDTTFATESTTQAADARVFVSIAKSGAPGNLTIAPALYVI